MEAKMAVGKTFSWEQIWKVITSRCVAATMTSVCCITYSPAGTLMGRLLRSRSRPLVNTLAVNSSWLFAFVTQLVSSTPRHTMILAASVRMTATDARYRGPGTVRETRSTSECMQPCTTSVTKLSHPYLPGQRPIAPAAASPAPAAGPVPARKGGLSTPAPIACAGVDRRRCATRSPCSGRVDSGRAAYYPSRSAAVGQTKTATVSVVRPAVDDRRLPPGRSSL
mmetsp:Transcript_31109/g.80339  ORF Transcript_31109/g.80339 Transcript_31109/m.80339 type:complete len:224 (+) Transcript_31109:706-1377(+)